MPSRCCSKSQRSFYVPPNRNANSEFEVNFKFSSLNKPYMKGVVLAERQMSSTDLGHKWQESSTHPIPSHSCCFSYSITFFLFAKWLTFFGVFLGHLCEEWEPHVAYWAGCLDPARLSCVSVHLMKVKQRFYEMISHAHATQYIVHASNVSTD